MQTRTLMNPNQRLHVRGSPALTKHIVAFAERYILHYDIDDARIDTIRRPGVMFRMMFHLAWISLFARLQSERILLYHGYNVLYVGSQFLTNTNFVVFFYFMVQALNSPNPEHLKRRALHNLPAGFPFDSDIIYVA